MVGGAGGHVKDHGPLPALALRVVIDRIAPPRRARKGATFLLDFAVLQAGRVIVRVHAFIPEKRTHP